MKNNILFFYILLLIAFIAIILFIIFLSYKKKENYKYNKIENYSGLEDDSSNDFLLSDFQKINSKYSTQNQNSSFNISDLEPSDTDNNNSTSCEEKCNKTNLDKDILEVLKDVENYNTSKEVIIKKKLRNFTYNNINYEGISNTNCYDVNDDFDNWCRYNYVPTDEYPLPSGYTLNNIGAQIILNGKEGECSSENFSRAICDFNSIQEVNKIEPVLDKNSMGISLDSVKSMADQAPSGFAESDHPVYNSKYNIFTDCMPLDSNPNSNINNFKENCAELLNVDKSDAIPTEIMGYDCTPGYYRSKCKKMVNFK